jgi:hypothetical protein
MQAKQQLLEQAMTNLKQQHQQQAQHQHRHQQQSQQQEQHNLHLLAAQLPDYRRQQNQ